MKLKISKALRNLPVVDYRALTPFQGNLKSLTTENYKKLLKSLNEFGFIVPIFIWKNDGKQFVIDAHQRLNVLKKEKVEPYELPYVEIEAANVKEAKKKLLVISSQYGTTTQEGMDEFAFDLDDEWMKETINFDALNFIDEEPESEIKSGLTEDDAVPDLQKTSKTKIGDVFQLGLHRVMCGDSTNAEMVQLLLGGAKPILMVTDPPYGVEYDPDWRNHASRDGSLTHTIGATAVGKVLNDDRADWKEAWALFPGNIAYVWHSAIHASEVDASLVASGFEIRSQIIWAKHRFAISRGHYHWQHEPCWYAVRKGQTGNWNGDRSQTTLWSITHNASDTGHGTQKPVECMLRPIKNNSVEGDVVYDPFLGSGTTLIAAEKAGRICYGMELSPQYVDVIIKRWQDFTGKQAIKL